MLLIVRVYEKEVRNDNGIETIYERKKERRIFCFILFIIIIEKIDKAKQL